MTTWFEKLIEEYARKDLSIRQRLQLIQKLAEITIQELMIIEAQDKKETP